jgi:transposase
VGNDKDCEQNDHKGKVEGLVGYVCRNFMVPIPTRAVSAGVF